MPDTMSFEGIRAAAVTIKAGATLKATFSRTAPYGTPDAQKAVAISANGEVELVATGGKVFGKLISLEPDGFAVVQDTGYAELPTDGTTITYGQGLIGGATPGTVKSDNTFLGVNLVAVHGVNTNKVYANIR